MKTVLNKTAKFVACALLAGGMVQSAQAANWLMLQGTEPTDSAPRAKVWGFIQAQYQSDSSTPNAGQGYIPPKLIGPDFTTQETFNINRARIGVRGAGMPLDSKVNYFFLAEFGNNGITAPDGGSAKITDASITLNHIKGAKVRVGLFKTPGSEEVYQGIMIFDYVNFTNYAAQQLIERVPNQNYTANISPQTLPIGTSLNGFEDSVGAARDTGVQVFDTFKMGNWEHSYSVMMGNGNGLNTTDNDSNKDTYLYWSSELVYGGQGARREGMKFFAWSQSGKRLLDNTNDSTHNPVAYDRKRSGAGVAYLKMPFRARFEYNKADGMIMVGPQSATFDMNPAGAPGNGENGTASAYYLDVGYYVPGTNWEIDGRYEVYNRLEGDQFETEWVTTTIGAQYHLNKKTRVSFNHEMRDVEAIKFATGAGPNAQVDGIDARTSVQLTHIF
ncbi:MAG: OprO/OprP family phosphate-selective porin [Gammaproteobacteria bacterium]|nr:OprO/OprP family phosphate-selective porin [Gammaproteobacteria bacterium]MDH5652508.1 OprO/OprP family phosphate-selective porin [Gammaproteobacteria bacterium]